MPELKNEHGFIAGPEVTDKIDAIMARTLKELDEALGPTPPAVETGRRYFVAENAMNGLSTAVGATKDNEGSAIWAALLAHTTAVFLANQHDQKRAIALWSSMMIENLEKLSPLIQRSIALKSGAKEN